MDKKLDIDIVQGRKDDESVVDRTIINPENINFVMQRVREKGRKRVREKEI